MKKMIEINPAKRLSAQECLEHEWIVNNMNSESDHNSPKHLKSAQSNMFKFQQE